MKLEYKRASSNNLKEIQELNVKFFQNQYEYDKDIILDWPLSEEGTIYFKSIIENEVVYVVYDNAKIVGYLAGRYDKGNPYLNKKIAEVLLVFVDSEYRGNSIGSKLVDMFKKECNEKGIYNYNVGVYCENLEGIKFWEKKGFDKRIDISLACNEARE